MTHTAPHTLSPRMDWTHFEAHAPAVIAALRALSQAVDASGLDKRLVELLKVRASQINGCAFCLQYHVNLARQVGVPQAQLDQLACWPESSAYTERERAVLAWAEQLTRMAQQPDTEAAWAALQAHFSAGEIAHLTSALGAIQAWNRIAGGLRFTPPPAK